MGMKLNVIGTMLLPLEDGSLADEHRPICAVITERFKNWINASGELHAVSNGDVGTMTLVSAETWIQSYQDNSEPIVIAEHSHERALFWLPQDLFVVTKPMDKQPIGDAYEQ